MVEAADGLPSTRIELPHANVYAAKGHHELQGADLAVTYATYPYPRFVRLTFIQR